MDEGRQISLPRVPFVDRISGHGMSGRGACLDEKRKEITANAKIERLRRIGAFITSLIGRWHC